MEPLAVDIRLVESFAVLVVESSLPGVFAVGDVRSRSVKRVASAVGEGSIAIRFASEHLSRRGGLGAR